MRHFLILLLSVALGAVLMACTDENIGVSIADTKSSIIEDSSFVITGQSVAVERIQMRSSTKLLGELQASGYGHLTASAVTQWMPAAGIDTTGVTTDLIDSCRLFLRIPYRDGFTGDSLAPMRLNAYRLNQTLPNPIYSDFDPTPYYSESDLLGSVSYSPRSAQVLVKVISNPTSSYFEYDTCRSVSIPMPVELGKELFTEYVNNPSTYSSPSNFAQYFPGIYVKKTYGSGHVMDMKYMELEVFYRRHTTTDAGVDTIIGGLSQSYLASTPEVVSDNILHLDVDDALAQRMANGEAIIVAPAGYDVKMQFPIQDIIDRFTADSEGDLAVLNKLEMEIPVDELPNAYGIAPPTYLLIVKDSMKDSFFDGDSLTNNKDSFYARYNATKHSYTFSGMRDYMLNILQNKGGIASADDINLAAVPVDVDTYSSTSSYSYYYGTSSSSVVTKISPQISSPALARLRLDKAKIKITYSKQSVF